MTKFRDTTAIQRLRFKGLTEAGVVGEGKPHRYLKFESHMPLGYAFLPKWIPLDEGSKAPEFRIHEVDDEKARRALQLLNEGVSPECLAVHDEQIRWLNHPEERPFRLSRLCKLAAARIVDRLVVNALASITYEEWVRVHLRWDDTTPDGTLYPLTFVVEAASRRLDGFTLPPQSFIETALLLQQGPLQLHHQQRRQPLTLWERLRDG